MNKFERLLLQYEREVKQSKRITWRDWAVRLRKKRLESEARQLGQSSRRKKQEDEETSKPKEFWVEVMQPSSGKQQATKTKGGRKRKQKQQEIWHLAKPGNRKAFQPLTRVLCIVPAIVDGSDEDAYSSSEDEEDEQCFAGEIVEIQDDHARVHFDGMTRKDDSWLPLDSPKLFIDGGRWGEDAHQSLPALHYWREEDSKKRCK